MRTNVSVTCQFSRNVITLHMVPESDLMQASPENSKRLLQDRRSKAGFWHLRWEYAISMAGGHGAGGFGSAR